MIAHSRMILPEKSRCVLGSLPPPAVRGCRIAASTKHFGFSKVPVFSTKVTERFKISPNPIGNDGGAKLHEFSPTGESISYTAQAAELWITDGSSLTPAAEILESTFQWWRKFIDEMSIS